MNPKTKAERKKLSRKVQNGKRTFMTVNVRITISRQRQNLTAFNTQTCRKWCTNHVPFMSCFVIHVEAMWTFRLISVTRSRTVVSTPWTGDQLVARLLLTSPGDCDDGDVGFCRGKPKNSEKNFPYLTFFTTNPTCQTRARTRTAAVGSQRLNRFSYGAAPYEYH
jgi:hypothetical protein